MIPRLSIFLLLSMVAAASIALTSPALASIDDLNGRWSGFFVADNSSNCKRPEWGSRVRVRNGEANFYFSSRFGKVEIKGDIDDNGEIKAFGQIGERASTITIKGKFTDNNFEGQFFTENAGCTGYVKVKRDNAAPTRRRPPPPHLAERGGPPPRGGQMQRQRFIAERQAKEKAEAETQAMQAKIARLQAEQETLKKKAELAALEAKNAQNKAQFASNTRSLNSSSTDVKSELAILKKLRDEGLISQSQYETKQQALLDKAFSGTRTASLQPAAKPKLKLNIPANIKFGDYHALVIGIDEYKYLTPLKTAIADAKEMAKVLKDNYGFKVTTLLNPTRGDIIDELDDLRSKLKFKDNLLIYYAGHGWLDDKADQGFWLPADAKPNRRSNWVSNDILTGTLKAIEAKHVMIVADSCYSGRLVRGAKVSIGDPEYLKKISRKKARVVITSGGLEPVADNAGDGHSPFTSALLKSLRSNNGVVDGNSLFNTIRRPVMVSADQTPQFSDIRKAGHDGGDFLFVPRK